MINIVLSSPILIGLILGSLIIFLHYIRIIKPELARDEDIFFTTISLIYSCIIVIHGWRLDPILLFSQILLIGALTTTGWENIRLRGVVLNLTKRKKENI